MEYCAQDLAEILLTPEQISQRVGQLARQITTDHEGQELTVLGILTGSFVFLADLLRQLDLPCAVDFWGVSSYGTDMVSSGQIRVEKDLSLPVTGKYVLVVEDIVDTGLTLNHLVRMLHQRGVTSVKVCCLLDKPARRRVPVKLDYVGFEIPDRFVVGYGLDFSQRYRNLPYVAVLKPDKYIADDIS